MTQKFAEQVQTTAAPEVELKSPLSPFSKVEFSCWDFQALFGKLGLERFSAE
jgi:hypothetical protein